MGLWTGPVSGALLDAHYRDELAQAGFEAIEVEPTRSTTVVTSLAWLGTLWPRTACVATSTSMLRSSSSTVRC